MRKIYIMDLKNRQDEYSAALDFIKAIKDEKSGTIEERQQIMVHTAKKISVTVGKVKNNFSPRYLEEPISISERGKIINGSILDRHMFSERDSNIFF